MLTDVNQRPDDILVTADRTTLAELELFRRKIGTDKMFDLLRQATAPQPPAIHELRTPMPEITASYLQSLKDRGCSDVHLIITRRCLNKFLNYTTKSLQELTVDDLDTFLFRYGNMYSRNLARGSLIRLFSFARSRRLLPPHDRSVAEQTVPVKIVTLEPAVFAPDELLRLLYHASPIGRTYLVLGGLCGIRTQEIMRMTWECWNEEEKSLVLGTSVTKTGRRRVVELEPVAVEWIQRLIPTSQEGIRGPVIPNHIQMRTNLKKAQRRSKVVWRKNALRHSYASYHLAKYRSAPLTSRNCGHSIALLERTYYQNVTRADADVWFSLSPSYVKETVERRERERKLARRCTPFSRFRSLESTPAPTAQPT